jgi:hypothetical protein
MKQMGCDHEVEVIRALRSGEWTGPLRRHAASCQDCSQAQRLAEALEAGARRAEARSNLPDPHWIFERARRRRREIAMRRMARLLAAMRTLAAIYVAAALAWFLRGYATLQYREVASTLHGASSQFALMGATVATVCVAAGLWPILIERGETHPGR